MKRKLYRERYQVECFFHRLKRFERWQLELTAAMVRRVQRIDVDASLLRPFIERLRSNQLIHASHVLGRSIHF